MALKIEHFEKQIRNTWDVLKCDARVKNGEDQLAWSCVKRRSITYSQGEYK